MPCESCVYENVPFYSMIVMDVLTAICERHLLQEFCGFILLCHCNHTGGHGPQNYARIFIHAIAARMWYDFDFCVFLILFPKCFFLCQSFDFSTECIYIAGTSLLMIYSLIVEDATWGGGPQGFFFFPNKKQYFSIHMVKRLN